VRIAIDYTPAVRQGAGIGRLTRDLVRAVLALESANEYVLFVAGRVSAVCRAEAVKGFSGRDPSESLRTTGHVFADVKGSPAASSARLVDTLLPERWLTAAWHRLRLPLPVESFVGHCDLFHSTDFVLPPTRSARGLVTVHDLTFLRYPECAHPALRAYLSAAVPRSLARAAHVLADSQATRNDLMELLGVAGERISVLYGGVSPHYRPDGDVQADLAVRRRQGLDRPYILSVGTLEPRKNYARLLQAFARLRQELALPHLLGIAGGRGWLYDEIFAQVERLELADAVRFLGFVADGDLPALYRGADVFVFPSLYEGFGFPPLEAMACGCPVVCSSASSLPEVVGDAALLINPLDQDSLADGLRLALSDRELRKHLVTAGQRQAARFDWTRAARQLLDVYGTL
jgi:glycosyltransferase involved in cell wall biosynthesis